MISIAIVGTGWWGMELGRAACAAPDRVRLAGCTSLAKAECERFQQQFGGQIYDSYAQILADASVDAVLLATPHSLHWRQIIAAAQAGKHVFCEKPLTLDVETASRAWHACEDAGVVLAVGHNRRYLPGARLLKSLVESGMTGRVVHVEADYSGSVEGRYPPGHWRVTQSELPAAGMTPMGLHMVDMIGWLLGPIVRLTAMTRHQVISYPLDDTCAAMFELGSGASGQIASHLSCVPAASIRLYGTRANIEARGNFTEVRIDPADPKESSIQHRFTHDGSLEFGIRALADACEGKADFPVRPIEALRNIAVLEAIVRSVRDGGHWTDVRQEAYRREELGPLTA
jgi:predicted dehydrogenase